MCRTRTSSRFTLRTSTRLQLSRATRDSCSVRTILSKRYCASLTRVVLAYSLRSRVGHRVSSSRTAQGARTRIGPRFHRTADSRACSLFHSRGEFSVFVRSEPSTDVVPSSSCRSYQPSPRAQHPSTPTLPSLHDNWSSSAALNGLHSTLRLMLMHLVKPTLSHGGSYVRPKLPSCRSRS